MRWEPLAEPVTVRTFEYPASTYYDDSTLSTLRVDPTRLDLDYHARVSRCLVCGGRCPGRVLLLRAYLHSYAGEMDLAYAGARRSAAWDLLPYEALTVRVLLLALEDAPDRSWSDALREAGADLNVAEGIFEQRGMAALHRGRRDEARVHLGHALELAVKTQSASAGLIRQRLAELAARQADSAHAAAAHGAGP